MVRPAQRYLNRLRSFTPNSPVFCNDDSGITGRVLTGKLKEMAKKSQPGLVPVVVTLPTWYAGELRYFTPDKLELYKA